MKNHGIEMVGGFYNQKLTELPVWQPSDEGRQVYLTDGTVWIGTFEEWKDISVSASGVDYLDIGDVSGEVTCDVSEYGVFYMNIITNTNVTFTGFTNNKYQTVSIKITRGVLGTTFTNVLWSNALPPALTLGTDRLIFSSSDGGNTIFGGLLGRDFN